MSEQIELDFLLGALQHSSEFVRAAAVYALNGLESDQVIELLIAALNDPSKEVKEAACYVLPKLGLIAASALLAVLQDPEADNIKEEAAQALRGIRNPEAVSLLCAVLDYPEPEARAAAAFALGEIAPQEAVQPLIEAIQHPHSATRIEACLALGKIGDNSAFHAIITLLGEENWRLRQAAIQALGQLGGPEALQPLSEALEDPLWKIRHQAALALLCIKTPLAEQNFIELIDNPNGWIRQIAAEALGEIGANDAVNILYQMANDDGDIQVRLSASQALLKLGDPRGGRIINRTINAPNAHIQQIAAIALGNTGDQAAVKHLLNSEVIKGSGTEDPERRFLKERILSALNKIGEPAIPELISALNNREPGVQATARQVLVKLGDKAAEELENVLTTGTNHNHREQVILVLGEINRPESYKSLTQILSAGTRDPYFLRALGIALYDRGKRQRILAAQALKNIFNPGALSALYSSALYDLDSEVRFQAKRSLAHSGDVTAATILSKPGLFETAYRALVGILFLVVSSLLLGSLLHTAGVGYMAAFSGIVAGGAFGFCDGLESHKRTIRHLGIGFLLVLLMGVIMKSISGIDITTTTLVRQNFLKFSAILFPAVGAITGWQSTSFVRRLTGLFVGMVTGFTGSIIGTTISTFIIS